MGGERVTRPTILWISDSEAGVAELGGKVNSLAELMRAGFDVPPAFGVTTSAFVRFARASDLPARIAGIRRGLDVGDPDRVAAASAAIAELIRDAPIPGDMEDDIRSAYARLCEIAGADAVPVAVRSSGVNEDLEGASFAGQYDTYLWISGADAVMTHVRRCWAGLFNPEVLTYRPAGVESAGAIDDGFPGMCVGVQVMVPARTAGVMFTLDPVSGDRSKISIESCWGLGEGVVKGDVSPDRHTVDKITLEILGRHISEQTEEYRFDAATGGVDLFPIDDGRGADASLTADQVISLAELGKRIERHRGGPQDLEWAIGDDGALHLLQARPETVWAARHAAKAAADASSAVTATSRVLSAFMGVGKKGAG